MKIFIEKINGPGDLKKLSLKECCSLANEIRKVLLEKASVYGGHVGSNLGIIEATIALHYVFNSPKDKFIFDVSHQCYTHKILTGRKESFLDKAHYGDTSGFTSPNESNHDIFKIGHTATSISLACGLAKARDLLNHKENIIALIGDGALSGGEALEGLDFAASELKSNIIIIVNDNGMSIAENHGGLYKNLEDLRNTCGNAKCNFFKALGFDYRYVNNGNDIKSLIDIFSEIKDIDHPIIIHIVTTKGKGYKFAEEDKENWHWRRPFDLKTGEYTHPFTGESYDRILNDYLLEKMKKDKSIIAISAGVPLTAGFTKERREKAGKQFIDVGIAEEHAIALAAGIAKNGGKPIFTTDCSFYQRTYDQISQELCINNCSATLLVRNASIFGQTDTTHLGLFDIPLLSNIPNLVYLAPTNAEEYISMLDWSIEQNQYPVAIRIPRFVEHDSYFKPDDYSILNKYKIIENGNKIAIIALGGFFKLGKEVSYELKKQGVKPTLINPRFITGIDAKLLNNLKSSHKIVITLEDGILAGGFGEKIASYYGPTDMRVLNFGLKKEFIDRYDPKEIMKKNHLTSEQIVEDIISIDNI